jgi:phosphatidylserine/phosphatidylglycerophosphate/cardiolipin synthase-like enzyme
MQGPSLVTGCHLSPLCHSRRQAIGAFVLALVMCLGPACTVLPDALAGDRATIVPPTLAGGAAGDWYRLYFTTPELTSALEQPSGGIPDRLAESFQAARQSIDVAVYEFDLMPLADALLAAAERGVRVRLVTDTDALAQAPIQALMAGGIPVVDDQR